MTELVLTGLEGRNPLGFLAALGTLRVVADATKQRGSEPRLYWKSVGTFRPVLVADIERDALVDLLAADAASFEEEPAILLEYRKGEGKVARDLKPPPGGFSTYLRSLVEDYLRSGATGVARSLALAAAFATDVATDNNGNTKPTALHFTAGQQEFLGMVRALQRDVQRVDFEEALFGPWRYARSLPVLQWDNSRAVDYALRAGDPSKEKKQGVPGADWLALRGLAFLPVAPRGDRVATTGCRGGWKTGAFRWPMWTSGIGCRVVSSLLTSPELFEVNPAVLRARGIPLVFEVSIGRSDQGGYGSFSPAGVARSADPAV